MKYANCHPNRQHCAKGLCKTCYNKQLRQINPEYDLSCKMSVIKRAQTTEGKLSKLNGTLLRRYGITLAQRNQMAIDQNHKCKLCDKKKRLVVEHCHSSGRVRGLVCDGCNTLIGFLETRKHLLSAAFMYINSEKLSKNEYFMDILSNV